MRIPLVLCNVAIRQHKDRIGAEHKEDPMCWAVAEPEIHLPKLIGEPLVFIGVRVLCGLRG